MFTIEQVAAAHAKVKSGADFPRYVRELKDLGLSHYDLMVADGRAVYFGTDGYQTAGNPKYPALQIAATGSAEGLKHAIAIHQQGQTDFMTFCRQAAESGIEKWTTDVLNMEVIYVDKAGNKLLVEPIPNGDY